MTVTSPELLGLKVNSLSPGLISCVSTVLNWHWGNSGLVKVSRRSSAHFLQAPHQSNLDKPSKKQPATLEKETEEPEEEESKSGTVTVDTRSEPTEVDKAETPVEPVEVASSSAVENSNTQE